MRLVDRGKRSVLCVCGLGSLNKRLNRFDAELIITVRLYRARGRRQLHYDGVGRKTERAFAYAAPRSSVGREREREREGDNNFLG